MKKTFSILHTCTVILGLISCTSQIESNDNWAQSNLNELAKAAETYASIHEGRYPENIDLLLNAEPPFIETNYCAQGSPGFDIDCAFNPDGYLFTATPQKVGESGTQKYSVSTGFIKDPPRRQGNVWGG